MTGPDRRLPEPLRRFLAQAISRVEHLEVTLLLRRMADRYWDAAAVADALGMREELAASALEALAGRNFLDVRLSDTIRYRYNPATTEQRESLTALAEAWRDRRALVLRELTGTRYTLSDFSDAFRLGRDEEPHG